MNSIHDIRRYYISKVSEANISTPSLCVDILLAFLLEYPSIHHMRIEAHEVFPQHLEEQCISLFERLLTGEPIAYIVGKKSFLDFEFIVNSHTLIPRPETEELVYIVLDSLKHNTAHILDIGTGSGCIICSLAYLCPQITGIAIDISYEALYTARCNANIYNCSSIQFMQADLYALPFQANSFTHIVANPPYISCEEYHSLDKSVALFEPYNALVSGITGQEASKAIIEQSYAILQDKGMLFMEIGHTQRKALQDYVASLPWSSSSYMYDSSHKERFLICTK